MFKHMEMSGMEFSSTYTYSDVRIITEQQLIKEWELNTPELQAHLRRMLYKESPKKTCPRYINPKHFFKVGDEYRFRYSPERGWPEVKLKETPSASKTQLASSQSSSPG